MDGLPGALWLAAAAVIGWVANEFNARRLGLGAVRTAVRNETQALVATLQGRVDALAAENEALRQRVDELTRENHAQAERIDKLEDALADRAIARRTAR